jgi:hypothetical protein
MRKISEEIGKRKAEMGERKRESKKHRGHVVSYFIFIPGTDCLCRLATKLSFLYIVHCYAPIPVPDFK